jgi:hypothetical protein
MSDDADPVANECFKSAQQDPTGTTVNSYLNSQSLDELQRLARIYLHHKSRLKTKTLLVSYLTDEFVVRANRNKTFLKYYLGD